MAKPGSDQRLAGYFVAGKEVSQRRRVVAAVQQCVDTSQPIDVRSQIATVASRAALRLDEPLSLPRANSRRTDAKTPRHLADAQPGLMLA
jgi:hypothetical protein